VCGLGFAFRAKGCAFRLNNEAVVHQFAKGVRHPSWRGHQSPGGVSIRQEDVPVIAGVTVQVLVKHVEQAACEVRAFTECWALSGVFERPTEVVLNDPVCLLAHHAALPLAKAICRLLTQLEVAAEGGVSRFIRFDSSPLL
jgi:hypothetical protein